MKEVHAPAKDDLLSFFKDPAFGAQVALNRRAWENGLRESVLRDYAGQYVALGNGTILAFGPDFDEVDAAVKRLQPDLECYLIFEAGQEPIFVPVLGC